MPREPHPVSCSSTASRLRHQRRTPQSSAALPMAGVERGIAIPSHRAGNDPVAKRRLTQFRQGHPRDAQSLVPRYGPWHGCRGGWERLGPDWTSLRYATPLLTQHEGRFGKEVGCVIVEDDKTVASNRIAKSVGAAASFDVTFLHKHIRGLNPSSRNCRRDRKK
jgi:hypothetical protein